MQDQDRENGLSHSARTTAVLVAAPALLILLIGLMSPGYSVSDSGIAREHPPGGDFLQEYVGGKIWSDPLQRERLYDPALFRQLQHDPRVTSFRWQDDRHFPPVYPPCWYAVTSPLAGLPYMTAARIWLFLMGASLVAALIVIRNSFGAHPAFLLAMCLSPPVLLSLATGQKGTLWLLIVSASLALLIRGKQAWSGATFSLMVFKPHLAVPIGIVMLSRRQWRWAASCLGTVLLTVLTTACFEPSLFGDYLSACLGMGDFSQTGGYKLAEGFSISSGLQLIIDETGIAMALTVVATLGVLAIGIMTARQVIPDPKKGFRRGAAALILMTVLVSPHLYSYDLTLLILPAALMWKSDEAGPKATIDRLVAILLLLVLFGKGLWVTMAEITGIPGGPVLLAIAWGLTIKSLCTKRQLIVTSPSGNSCAVPAIG